MFYRCVYPVLLPVRLAEGSLLQQKQECGREQDCL